MNYEELVFENKPKEVAPASELGELHGQLARTLRNIMVGGEVVKDKKGNPVALTPSPAILNVVRQFLKDNNIQTELDESGLGDILDDLPYTETGTGTSPKEDQK